MTITVSKFGEPIGPEERTIDASGATAIDAGVVRVFSHLVSSELSLNVEASIVITTGLPAGPLHLLAEGYEDQAAEAWEFAEDSLHLANELGDPAEI